MGLETFTFDRDQTPRFMELEYSIYSEDRQWIPPLRSQRCARMQPSFWFYRNAGNGHRHFLATLNGEAVGRASAFWNRDLHDTDGTPVGMVGNFECIDDYSIARDLLEAATEWLRETYGATRIWGPMTFDIWHGYRFKTGGFHQTPFLGEPHNMPYYPEFFQQFGFIEKQTWDSVELVGRDEIRKMIVRGKDRFDTMVARGYSFSSVSMRSFEGDMRILYGIISDSYSTFLGSTPITQEAFLDIVMPHRLAIDPRFFHIVRDEEGAPAGFIGAFRDLGDAVRSMRGNDSIRSRMRFMIHRQRPARMNLFFGGMTHREMSRRSGLGRAAFYHLVSGMVEAGVEDLIIALRSRDNYSRGYLGDLNNRRVRTYALYEWRA